MSRATQRHRRTKRRLEAEERQECYDGLTMVLKMAQCVSRPGESKRELARLRAQCPEQEEVNE